MTTNTAPALVGCFYGPRRDGHRKVRVFIGKAVGARALSGVLTVREEEWPEVRRWLESAPYGLFVDVLRDATNEED